MSENLGLSSAITGVVVNYRTPELLDRAVRSFHEAYPDIRVLIVDNGSEDESIDVIDRLETDYTGVVDSLRLSENLYHGPAMDRAIQRLETPYVYLFDSDTLTRTSGFLERMIEELESRTNAYGAGRVLTVNSRGFASEDGTRILWAPYMLIDRAIYRELPPFEHHGVPVLRNMEAAEERGYELVEFPVEEYVEHLGRGTASKYGYGLGLRSRLNNLLHRLGLDRLLERVGL